MEANNRHSHKRNVVPRNPPHFMRGNNYGSQRRGHLHPGYNKHRNYNNVKYSNSRRRYNHDNDYARFIQGLTKPKSGFGHERFRCNADGVCNCACMVCGRSFRLRGDSLRTLSCCHCDCIFCCFGSPARVSELTPQMRAQYAMLGRHLRAVMRTIIGFLFFCDGVPAGLVEIYRFLDRHFPDALRGIPQIDPYRYSPRPGNNNNFGMYWAPPGNWQFLAMSATDIADGRIINNPAHRRKYGVPRGFQENLNYIDVDAAVRYDKERSVDNDSWKSNVIPESNAPRRTRKYEDRLDNNGDYGDHDKYAVIHDFSFSIKSREEPYLIISDDDYGHHLKHGIHSYLDNKYGKDDNKKDKNLMYAQGDNFGFYRNGDGGNSGPSRQWESGSCRPSILRKNWSDDHDHDNDHGNGHQSPFHGQSVHV